jgi:hypothetical protein
VTGPVEALREFYELAQGVGADGDGDGDNTPCELDFRQHVPEASADALNEDTYSNYNAWGTSANICASELKCVFAPEEGYISYDFTTKNSPPDAWLRVTAGLHNDCRFELVYGEGGCCFAGELVIDGGQVLREDEYVSDEAIEFLSARSLEWMVGIFKGYEDESTDDA